MRRYRVHFIFDHPSLAAPQSFRVDYYAKGARTENDAHGYALALLLDQMGGGVTILSASMEMSPVATREPQL